MSEFVIETDKLTRYFGAKCAVDGVNLHVPRGGVFALLGRNGSGKTTLIRMLLGLLEPTRGSAQTLGNDCRRLPPESRARIGYMPEGHPLYGWMNVRETGAYQASFYPKWNQKIFRAIVDHFRLDERTKVKHLSRGERAGLSLAVTLATEPELLVLDDPSLGLDPVARRALLEAMVFVTGSSERTIFFSTHTLSDVERVADRIAILDRSVLRACCSVETFRSRVRQMLLRFDTPPPALPEIKGLLCARREGNELRLTLANMNGDAESLIRSLKPNSVEELPLSLEDAIIGYLDARSEGGFLLQGIGEES
ncbi:MAG: ABC transporter ATP-binding protein [Candidatus Sumerlaeota bacterium]|nr:ABC transporter ATP-binding protein [Candidatus Sumerlaeota bacterium]